MNIDLTSEEIEIIRGSLEASQQNLTDMAMDFLRQGHADLHIASIKKSKLYHNLINKLTIASTRDSFAALAEMELPKV